jgi:hypothetical protein
VHIQITPTGVLALHGSGLNESDMVMSTGTDGGATIRKGNVAQGNATTSKGYK